MQKFCSIPVLVLKILTLRLQQSFFLFLFEQNLKNPQATAYFSHFFPLCFRARLRRRESSSAAADHHDSPAARHHRHEILVCVFESVSPAVPPQLSSVAPTTPEQGVSLVLVLQSVSVQWREHDGPLQSGHLLWSDADANTRWPGPRVLPGPR